MRTTCRLCAVALATLACDSAPIPEDEPRQWYHARVTTGVGNDVPFFLELPSDCQDLAFIANGEERIPVACERLGDQLTLEFPVYGTTIVAGVDPAGNVRGRWVRMGDDGRSSTMGFSAGGRGRRRSATALRVRDPAERWFHSSYRRIGEWQMNFDHHGAALGIFDQAANGVLRGTVIVPSEYGDLRFLAGNVHGNTFSLSTFNGQYATVLSGTIEPDGTLRGTFVCCGEDRDAFVAARTKASQVVDPLRQVQVTSRERRLDFEPLLEAPYVGRPVVLEIFGTWCPNCNDLAPLLADLYDDYHDDGLEMVAVAYELSESEAYKQERISAYREKYGVEWEIIFADAAPEDLFGDGPAELSPIGGVPVTIFLNRDRTIQAIYSGFRGPATGGGA